MSKKLLRCAKLYPKDAFKKFFLKLSSLTVKEFCIQKRSIQSINEIIEMQVRFVNFIVSFH